ncbi:MAG: lysylphosphatidylglycerol synthase transmembrane domain-containing protein [Bryobacteraceae bacterium]
MHDFEPEKLAGEIAAMNWKWVAAAVVFDILVYFLQGWRWSLLLRPVADIPFSRSVRAIYVGLFANEILPLRTGEVIRCYLQARWSGLPFTVVLSSALIERVFDGIWLIVCLLVTMRFVQLPDIYTGLGQALALIVLLGSALLGAAMFSKPRHAIFSNNRWLKKISVILEDLYLIGIPNTCSSRPLPVCRTCCQVVPIYALAQGYGIGISLAQGFALRHPPFSVGSATSTWEPRDLSGSRRLWPDAFRRRFQPCQAIFFCHVGHHHHASTDRRLHRTRDNGAEAERDHEERGIGH